MRQWISRNFLQLLIIIGFVIFGLRECSNKNNISKQNYSDTTHLISYEKHDTIVISKPQLINTYHTITKTDSILYQPSSNYDSLLVQYNDVKDSLLAFSVYKDHHLIDTIGSIDLIDTIHKNKIYGRSISWNINVPVKETIIKEHIFEPNRNKWYIGGSLGGNQQDYIDQVKVGILFQNKRDRIFGLSATSTKDLKLGAEISLYWKIHLKK